MYNFIRISKGGKMSTDKKQQKKSKKSFFKVLGNTFLFIILLIVGWCVFSALHRKDTKSLLPEDYSVYVKIDSVWDAINPIIDLQVADVVLSTPELASVKGALISFRQSPLRSNIFVDFVASRPVEVGVYMDEKTPNILGIVDLGVFSSVSRLAKIVLPFFDIKGLSLVKSEGFEYFEFANEEGVPQFFLKILRNTVIFSTNKDLLVKSCTVDHRPYHTEEELALMNKKVREPIKIIADARGLLESMTEGEQSLTKISGLLSQETKALISLSIKDSEIYVNADIPLENSSENADKSLEGINNLLSANSTMPQLLGHLSNIVQYYTIINAGTIQQITEAAFPLLPEDVNINSLWKTANSLSKTLFKLSLDDLLFSWTGKECAAVGIEGLNAPVFVLQIKDEAKRREVFDNVLSSIIFHDDTSLILNGLRLPKIYFPSFIQNILKAFKINLPNPYYLVHNGFVYFSESPEVLSSIYTSSVNGSRISFNENWHAVSEKQSLESTLSLFYDLERSEPFFVRGDNIISKVLELYTIGRCDVSVKEKVLSFQLSVASRPSGQVRKISGYPIALGGKSSQLQLENAKNPSYIFWVENGKTVKSMNITSSEGKELEFPSNVYIVADNNKLEKEGKLWIVTAEGGVYKVNRDLSIIEGYPILLESKPSTSPIVFGESLAVSLSNKKICLIGKDKVLNYLDIPTINGSILSTPTVQNSKLAFYDKGFLGQVHVVGDGNTLSYNILGIAYGSPAILEKEGDIYTAFVTQAGGLTIWCDKEGKVGFPLEKRLWGVFYTNVVSNGKYFYAIASDGMIYRISLDGGVVSVKIPNASAKEPSLSVVENNIYVGIDGNLIYGFNENLELLQGFPITGTGNPVFVDANGDGNSDCFALTIDNKLNAWNLR